MPCLSFKLPRNPLHQHLALELMALFGAQGILVGGGILPVEDAFQVPKEVGNGIAEWDSVNIHETRLDLDERGFATVEEPDVFGAPLGWWN